ncbi:hypothetical protein J7J95_01580 [bacterium]|nr:hypothetical protein [bacterium]
MMKKLDEWFEKINPSLEEVFLKKLPSLPDNIVDIIVKITPWLVLIVGVMSIPGILAVLGVGGIFSVFPLISGRTVFVYGIVALVQLAVELMAVPKLFKKELEGWKLLFWANTLGILTAVLNTSVFGLLGVAISYYILYQIKAAYK